VFRARDFYAPDFSGRTTRMPSWLRRGYVEEIFTFSE
jgi:hypothetical protein